MRILLLGAGGPAGVNVLRALHQAGHDLTAADQNEQHLIWCEPYAATVHMPDLDMATVNDVGADVVMAQPDPLVLWLADHADQLDAATFLPDRRVVTLCQDKFDCGLVWRRAKLRTDESFLIDSVHAIWWEAGDRLGYPFWLRARHGAGAKGAILARSPVEARLWFSFWRERHPFLDFVAEGFLPGRDLAWAGIYHRGELVTSFARERIEYLYPHLTPEGLTGTPTIATVVHDDAVNAMAEAAVDAVDPNPHGVYCVDLREDDEGVPRPTEINAGRFCTTIGLWSLAGPNFADLAARFAYRPAAPPHWEQRDALPEGLTLSRHIDCGHVFAQVKERVPV